MKSSNLFLLLFLFLCGWPSVFAQDTLSKPAFNIKRFAAVTVSTGSVYGITLVGLNQAWYKDNSRRSFHFFGDLHEWQQVDKAGHVYSSFHLSNTSIELYKWAGMQEKKAIWLGSLTGMLLMTPIEILDGFSKDYGASWTDFLANTAGSALTLQRLIWKQSRIHPKFSFHLTPYAALRPNTLGDNIPQRMLKDYNGQTYWLSFDIQPWLSKQTEFPAWLTVALGYGAQNMVYADKELNLANGYNTYRQYYLSLDINFTRISVRNKLLKYILFCLNTIHIPAPALEFNKKGMRFHPLYF